MIRHMGNVGIILAGIVYLTAWTQEAGAAAAQAPSFRLWQLPNQTPTQMMSYVLLSSRRKILVIDGGNPGDAPYLARFLKEKGGHVTAWFISHPHIDHVGALTEILKKPDGLKIDALYGSLPERSWMGKHASKEEMQTYTRFMDALKQAGRTVEDLELGQTLQFDEIRIQVLGIRNPEITGNAINNSSVILRVSDSHKSVLFPGDLGVEGGEKALKGPYADQLPSLCVQMAHHGQNGVGLDFYRKVNPRYCLWPTPKWLWDNDNGGGKGSGPWRTLEVRKWMASFPIKKHYRMFDGLQEILINP